MAPDPQPPLGSAEPELSPPGGPGDPFEIQVRRSQPPEELLGAMARAGRIHDELREAGLEVRFSCAPDAAPGAGLYAGEELLRALPPAQAAEIAAGVAAP